MRWYVTFTAHAHYALSHVHETGKKLEWKARDVDFERKMVSQMPGMTQIPGLSSSFGNVSMEQALQGEMNVGRDLVAELVAEKESLEPSFVHCLRLLDGGMGEKDDNREGRLSGHCNKYILF